MKKNLIIIIIIIQTFSSRGQTPVGSWSDHLNYTTARNVAVGEAEVIASTGSSLIVYNKEFAELRKMTRINGLTETGISTIAWSEEHKALIIAYSTTNVDILRNNKIYNIPDISRKYIPGKKEINRIRINGKYAYLACSFGIVVLDIDKREIYDTWKPGPGSENTEVWDLAFGGGNIFAATGAGVYSADLSDQGLAYFGNWNIINTLPDPLGVYTSIVFSGNVLYANHSVKLATGDYVYAINNGYSLFSFTPGVFNSSFEPASEGFTISSSASVKYYSSEGSLLKTITYSISGTPKISQAIADDKDIWIADLNSGLIRGEDMMDFTPLTLPGPVSNNAYSITSLNGKTIICGGGADVSWNNLWRPLEVSVHENNKWISLAPVTIKDPMRALIDPSDNDHYFVSTWGGGLLEYQKDILINQFNDSNSPLQTVIPNKPFVRIGGLAMDKERRLWFTHNEVPGSIKALKTDGSWIINPAITINVYTIGDIIIARNGYKWVVLPRGNGLFVLDDNNTPEDFNDDRYKTMLIQDADNKIVSFVYTIAEDLDGHIWVGTDQGPLIYYNPERVFDEEIKAYRIKISRSDESGTADYLLGTESITSIAVDGANKKWLGTFSSGVYHLSSDGATLIKNFNEKNSPVLSNSIVSMAVDNKTGDVWIGTSKGVQSFRGNAVSGEDKLADIYTFPNPVREDYSGNVTIAGLMRDTQIRITDISGNLVYRTISDGGFATWDLKTYNGKKVATGVYLVFCASSDGSQSAVTKMLVIK